MEEAKDSGEPGYRVVSAAQTHYCKRSGTALTAIAQWLVIHDQTAVPAVKTGSCRLSSMLQLPIARIANWRQLPPTLAAHYLQQLSAPERQRLAGLRTDDARQQFLAARGLARELLCRYDPEQHDWQLAPSGPPAVAERPDWQLSLSHSGDWVAAALSRQPIGIDLEDRRRPRRYTAIARHYFHPEEADALIAAPAAQQAQRFLLSWTAREAYLKALGVGIAGGLQRLRVDFDPAGQPQVSLCDGGRDWHFTHCQQGPLVACVAWQGRSLNLRPWSWQQSVHPRSAAVDLASASSATPEY